MQTNTSSLDSKLQISMQSPAREHLVNSLRLSKGFCKKLEVMEESVSRWSFYKNLRQDRKGEMKMPRERRSLCSGQSQALCVTKAAAFSRSAANVSSSLPAFGTRRRARPQRAPHPVDERGAPPALAQVGHCRQCWRGAGVTTFFLPAPPRLAVAPCRERGTGAGRGAMASPSPWRRGGDWRELRPEPPAAERSIERPHRL